MIQMMSHCSVSRLSSRYLLSGCKHKVNWRGTAPPAAVTCMFEWSQSWPQSVCVLASLTPWPLTLGTSLFTACACCVCMCVTIVRAQQFAELSPAPFTPQIYFFFKGSFLRGQRSCYWNKDRWSFYLLVLVQHLSIITAVDVCQLMLALCVFVCVCVWEGPSCLI